MFFSRAILCYLVNKYGEPSTQTQQLYPKDPELFRQRVKNNFFKNKDVTDPEEIKHLLNRGEYIVKEIEALYMLRKYRTLKRRYYDTDEAADQAKFQAIEKLAQQHEPNKK